MPNLQHCSERVKTLMRAYIQHRQAQRQCCHCCACYAVLDDHLAAETPQPLSDHSLSRFPVLQLVLRSAWAAARAFTVFLMDHLSLSFGVSCIGFNQYQIHWIIAWIVVWIGRSNWSVRVDSDSVPLQGFETGFESLVEMYPKCLLWLPLIML